MRDLSRGVVVVLALAVATVSVQAGDLSAAPAAAATPASPNAYHPFQIRLKVAGAVPLDGASTIYDSGSYYPGVGSLARASGAGPGPGAALPGASSAISWAVMPMVDFAYYLDRNWSIETICCLAPAHVQGAGTLYGASIANTWAVPPTVTLQYHFTRFGAFQPYIGAGANFTFFLGTRAGNNNWRLGFNPTSPLAAMGVSGATASFYATSVTPSWGVVGQLGADYMFDDRWGVNVDVKYMMIEPIAHANIIATMPQAPLLGAVYLPVTAAVKINPLIVSTGLTYRFGDGFAPAALDF